MFFFAFLLLSSFYSQECITKTFRDSLDGPRNTTVYNPISRNFTIDEGLISNETHDILSDSKGFIWIATDGGICKYDGTKFVNFSLAEGLPERMVTRLYEDKKGRIWFITLSSYVGYILHDKVFALKHQFKKGPAFTGVDDFAYSMYVDEQEVLWVGTIFSGMLYNLAYPYQSKPLEKHYETNFVIEFNQKGDYVYGTRREVPDIECTASVKLDYEQKWRNKKKIFETPFKFEFGSQLHKLVKVSPDEFYMCGKSVFCALRNGKFEVFSLSMVSLGIDPGGKLWISTPTAGMYVFEDRRNLKKWKRYFKEEYITCSLTDIEGGTWISTLYNGVKYIPEFSFQKVLDGKDFEYIVSHKDKILVNQKLGDLVVLEKDRERARYKSHLYYFESLGTGNEIFGYQVEKSGSLIIFDISNGTYKTYQPAPNGTQRHVKKIVIYKNVVYTSISSGVTIYDQETGVLKVQFSTKSRINNFVIVNDTIWLATNNGLFSYDLNGKRWIKNDFATKNLRFRIDELVASESGLWLSTFGKGLIYYDKKGKLSFFNQNTGLLSNYIRYLYLDKHKNLWIASNFGVSRIKLSDNNKMVNYSYVGGYDLGQINKMLRVNDDLYITTASGLFKLPVRELDKRNKILPVYITGANSRYTKGLKNNAVLASGDDQLKINFLALNYANSGKTEYYYRLKGFDDIWHKTGNSSVVINKLPPGEYCFIVKTGTNPQATFNFSISYPLWQKWWFIGLVIFGLVISSYLMLRYRTRKIKAEEQQKNSIQVQIASLQANVIRAQMNPHFMFNALNSIQAFILANENKQANFYLGKFSSLMRKIIQISRHDFVTIKEELRLLQDYIEIERMRCAYSFDYEIRVEDKGDYDIQIPAMIIQPFIENAINHGLAPLEDRKGELLITFQKKEKNIICTITDNGIGREKAMEIRQRKIRYHQSASIKLTENRIDLYNKLYKAESRISIIDLQDERHISTGTRVEIIIPAK